MILKTADIVAELHRQSLLTIDLGDGRKVTAQRLDLEPGAIAMQTDLSRGQLCVNQVTDWQGVTLSDIGVGTPEQASEVVAFAPEIFQRVIFNRIDWINIIAAAITTDFVERAEAYEDNKKKSMTGSNTKASKTNSRAAPRGARKKK